MLQHSFSFGAVGLRTHCGSFPSFFKGKEGTKKEGTKKEGTKKGKRVESSPRAGKGCCTIIFIRRSQPTSHVILVRVGHENFSDFRLARASRRMKMSSLSLVRFVRGCTTCSGGVLLARSVTCAKQTRARRTCRLVGA